MYFSRIRLRPNIQESSSLHRLIRGNGYSVHQLLWDLFPRQSQRSFIFREEIAREQLRNGLGIKGEPVYYLVSQERPLGQTILFSVESKEYLPQLETGVHLAFKLRANPVVARKEAGKKNSGRHDIVMDAQRNFLRELANDLGTFNEGKKSALRHEILTAWRSSKMESVGMKLRTTLKENERYREVLDQEHSPDGLFSCAMKALTDKALEKWLTEKGNHKGFRLLRSNKDGRLEFQAEGYRWHALPKKGRVAGFSTVDFDGILEVCDPAIFIDALFKGIGPAKAFGCGLMLVRRV